MSYSRHDSCHIGDMPRSSSSSSGSSSVEKKPDPLAQTYVKIDLFYVKKDLLTRSYLQQVCLCSCQKRLSCQKRPTNTCISCQKRPTNTCIPAGSMPVLPQAAYGGGSMGMIIGFCQL
jgi:hypothetical protein